MNNKIIIIAGSVLGIGLLSWLLFKEPKTENQEEGKADEPQSRDKTAPPKERPAVMKVSKPAVAEPEVKKVVKPSPPPPKKAVMKVVRPAPPKVEKETPPPPIGDEFPLRLGSKGPRVERLNVWLTRNYGWTGLITDEFDNTTQGQVKRFLKKDEIDEKTYKRMRMAKPVFEQRLMR